MARIFTYLVVDTPDEPQQTIIWDTLEIAVGRVADQDLVISDSEVSRKHALFRIEGDAYTIADLHTSNGTFVNGSQIRTHALRPGDVVEVGPARIQFRQEAESPMGGGAQVRFSSQLKGFPEMDSGEGGQTVLGIAPDASLTDGLELGEDLSHLGPAGELQLELGDELFETPEAAAPQVASAAAPELQEVPPILEVAGFAEEADGFGEDFTEAAVAELEKDEPPAAVEPAAPAEPAPPPAPAVQPAPPAAQPVQPAPPAVQPVPPAPPAAQPVPPAPPAAQPVPPAPPAAQPVPPAPAAQPGQAPTAEPPALAAQPQPASPARAAAPEPQAAAIQLVVEFEGPREVLREVVGRLLEQEISIPPLKVRLKRPPRS